MRKARYLRLLFVCLLLMSASAKSIENLDEQPLSAIALFGDSIIVGVQFSTGFSARFGRGLEPFGCPQIYLRNMLRNEGTRIVDFGPPPVPCPTTNVQNGVELLQSPVRDRIERARVFRNSIVFNWGIGGSTSSEGVSRLNGVLGDTTSQSQGAAQRILLVHYGTNDPGRGISTSQTAFNLSQIVSRGRSMGYTPAISTLLPRSGRDVASLNNAIRNLSSQINVPLVDMFDAFLNWPGSPNSSVPLEGIAGQQGGATSLLPIETFAIAPGVFVTTRLHPNDQGYIVMAERWVEDFLEEQIPGIRQVIIAPIIDLIL